jgi:hypothetical protein
MRMLVLLGAAGVATALLVISAFAPNASGGCPDTGDPVGRPIASPAERVLIASTFSSRTIDDCWPGTVTGSR